MPRVPVRKRLKPVKRKRPSCSDHNELSSGHRCDVPDTVSLSVSASSPEKCEQPTSDLTSESYATGMLSENVAVHELDCSLDIGRVEVMPSCDVESNKDTASLPIGVVRGETREREFTVTYPIAVSREMDGELRESFTRDHTYASVQVKHSTSDLSHDFDGKDLLQEASNKISFFLHKSWVSHVSDGGIHVMLLSRKFEKSVQRRLFFAPSGEVKLSVHCVPLTIENYLHSVGSLVGLNSDTLGEFVDRCVEIVNIIRKLEICAGFDDEEYKHVWNSVASACVDKNPYQENRYTETLRSEACERLVSARKWRCNACSKLRGPLHRRTAAFEKTDPHPATPNIALSDTQKLHKLVEQRKKVNALNRRLERMQQVMQQMLSVEGIHVSCEVSDDLVDILKGHDLNPVQSLFLQQQLQASKAKNPSSIRWHPSMIRFALALYMASPSCYQTARDSGMIKLPSQRTLFDYTHVNEAKEGVDDVVLRNVSKRVENRRYPYQKYHALLCDEMHICQNLVYRKATGQILGYVKLEGALADIAALEAFLDSGDPSVKPQLATKMLSFMVKGISSDVKEVVASFSVNRLTTESMYSFVWEVINRCERSGIAILVFVSDGCSINRSFMKKHKPAKVTKSGLIYATINKAAPHRLLYFMSDVAHLLKTIRNCLNNSRMGKNAKRCLQKNGEKLLWQSIIDLYNAKKGLNLRRAYKLNAQNVFPDSYSQMKVKYAAEVLSRTVANDLEEQAQKKGWPNTKELVKFIRLVNDWFDRLNGAFSDQGNRTRNHNLDPYRSEQDPRFEELMKFLDYLSEWKEEVYSVDALANNLSQSFQEPENVSFDPVQEEERNEGEQLEQEPETKASKKMLSTQTLDGIEFTTMAFIDATKFLIKEGTEYVNPRVLSQDHLEQYFSKQRHRSGGSSNPNYGRFLQNNVNIHLQGQLGVKKRKGNTEDKSGGMLLTHEPLPKRKRSRISSGTS